MQAEHEGAEARAVAAGKVAEAAEKRCEELQWRLQQQDVALAQRTKLVQEAGAAAEGLTKVRCHANQRYPQFHTDVYLSSGLPLRTAVAPHASARKAAGDLHVGLVLLWLALADGVRQV